MTASCTARIKKYFGGINKNACCTYDMEEKNMLQVWSVTLRPATTATDSQDLTPKSRAMDKPAIVILAYLPQTGNWQTRQRLNFKPLQAIFPAQSCESLQTAKMAFQIRRRQLATIVPLTVDGCQLISVCTLLSPVKSQSETSCQGRKTSVICDHIYPALHWCQGDGCRLQYRTMPYRR